ncbi:serine/threonine-protein kinase [Trichoderma gamsii]|uniref:Serine/threonine-protein kinase n=1 Tax=Trichoderma gamsii TaxID=398673 RepID=A0A2P4Z8L2_9HYPO|nr:serine/threonine-protein kinase [Trichoderma gamsii]PON20623.1 serine/threonine-protein kinase [Trichoderma gamsii]
MNRLVAVLHFLTGLYLPLFTTPILSSQTTKMDVLETNKAFEDVGGEYQFMGTLVVHRDDGGIPRIFESSLYDTIRVQARASFSQVLIPVSAYMPLFPSSYSRAPDPLPSNIFVKQPSLISYDRYHQEPQTNCIADGVLREAANLRASSTKPTFQYC